MFTFYKNNQTRYTKKILKSNFITEGRSFELIKTVSTCDIQNVF